MLRTSMVFYMALLMPFTVASNEPATSAVPSLDSGININPCDPASNPPVTYSSAGYDKPYSFTEDHACAGRCELKLTNWNTRVSGSGFFISGTFAYTGNFCS